MGGSMTNFRARICEAAIALAIVAGMCIAPVAVHGQAVGMNVNVPFDFYVGSGKLPAGRYLIRKASIDPAVIQVADANGHSVVALTNGGPRRSDSLSAQLIFNAYDGYYFLSE